MEKEALVNMVSRPRKLKEVLVGPLNAFPFIALDCVSQTVSQTTS